MLRSLGLQLTGNYNCTVFQRFNKHVMCLAEREAQELFLTFDYDGSGDKMSPDQFYTAMLDVVQGMEPARLHLNYYPCLKYPRFVGVSAGFEWTGLNRTSCDRAPKSEVRPGAVFREGLRSNGPGPGSFSQQLDSRTPPPPAQLPSRSPPTSTSASPESSQAQNDLIRVLEEQNTEIAQLSSQLGERAEEVQVKEKEVEELQSKLEEQQSKLAQQEEDVKKLRKDAKHAEPMINSLRQKVRQLEQLNTTQSKARIYIPFHAHIVICSAVLNSKHNACCTTQLDDVQELEQLTESSTKMSKEIRGLKSDKTGLVKKLQMVNDERQLQAALVEKQEEGEQIEHQKHKKQMMKMSARIKDLESQLQDTQLELQDQLDLVGSESKDAADSSSREAMLQEQIDELETENERLRNMNEVDPN